MPALKSGCYCADFSPNPQRINLAGSQGQKKKLDKNIVYDISHAAHFSRQKEIFSQMSLRFKVMNRNKINKEDLISGLVLIISAVFALFHLTSIPSRAAIFPQVMLWGILILSGLLVLKSLSLAKISRSDRRRETAEPGDQKAKKTASEEKDSVLIAASLITVGLYISLLPILGFFLATIFFIFAILFVLKMRRYVLMTVLAIVTSGLVFVVFKTVMYISLPSGIFDPTEYLYRLMGQ